MEGVEDHIVETLRTPATVNGRAENPVEDKEIQAQLERVVASSLFCHSKRLSRFLRFVVEESLAGRADQLKERTLGIEVFDRSPSYDSALDPIVRVAAGDLRKRLAQYYVQAAHDVELRILLPPGHYRPVFCRPEIKHGLRNSEGRSETAPITSSFPPKTATPQADTPALQIVESEELSIRLRRPFARSADRARGVLSGVLGTLMVLGVVAATSWISYFALHRPERDLRSFWAPLVSASSPVLCVGNWDHNLLTDIAPEKREAIVGFLSLRNLVGPGNLAALTNVSGLLGEFGAPGSVVQSDGVSLTDLRASPAVFIGVFDNRWSPLILKGGRFQFQRSDSDPSASFITDSRNPTRRDWRVDHRTPLAALQRDYALITKMHSALTGQTDFVIAGITLYGTIAASEFVTRPEYFQQFTAAAPHNWINHDIQIVIGADVVDGKSAPPKILAFEVR